LTEFSQAIDRRGAGYQLRQEQVIDRGLETTFEFFSDPYNLEDITPGRLRFRVLEAEPTPVTKGTTIRYRLRIWGVPVTWISEISRWEPPHEFRDEMNRGPYATWEHTHRFEEIGGDQTKVIDEVYYELPLGLLGRMAAGWAVRWDVSSIFRYRAERMSDIFS
jgi:ligand-binding SRPBCC domain-containing protein